MSTSNPWPSELRLNPSRDVLTVAFDDGARFELRAEYLRVESPSAEIRNHGGPKTILTGKEAVKIDGLEPVGNYAVRIGFDDGHDSGLFSWDYLHKLGAEEERIWADYQKSLQRVKQDLPDTPDQTANLRRVAPSMRSVAQLPRGKRIAVVKGQDNGRFMDFYHNILTASWPMFFAQLAALFIIVNLVFAMLYVIDRNGIANARPGSFTDAFFFSVQTLGTLGYGVMAPRTLYANLLVTVESFTGILTIALFTGIIFARFSRPFARVIFSNVAVVTSFDGVPTLMFRTANQRGEAIMDASIVVTLARQHTTLEGVTMRRFQELTLMRSSNSLFALSWTVMHAIDAQSPLYGLTPEEMQAQDMEIIVTLNGLDEILADRIYARHAYWADEILWNRRFVDVISVTPAGHRMVDLTQFHDTKEY